MASDCNHLNNLILIVIVINVPSCLTELLIGVLYDSYSNRLEFENMFLNGRIFNVIYLFANEFVFVRFKEVSTRLDYLMAAFM